jgi:phospholipid-translocating ATPase
MAGEQSERSQPAKRIRWATKRVKGPKADAKRISIFNRRLSRRGADEKKRESGGSAITDPKTEGDGQDGSEEQEEQKSRRIYFNQPLPASELDEDGKPLHHFARNKIRTAKYTPLSFIPKNLYFQFHNVANIFFAIIIILGVRTQHTFQY